MNTKYDQLTEDQKNELLEKQEEMINQLTTVTSQQVFKTALQIIEHLQPQLKEEHGSV